MEDINDMTMEEYMARTRTDHGAWVVQPRIEDNVASETEIETHILNIKYTSTIAYFAIIY